MWPAGLGLPTSDLVCRVVLSTQNASFTMCPSRSGMDNFLPTQGHILKFPNDRGPHDNVPYVVFVCQEIAY